jgi:hypothetical protein
MGLKPSPYMAVWFYYLAMEFAQGLCWECTNPLRWDYIRLNLPGDPAYDPTLPQVMKWDKSIKNIAGDLVAFVDNLRASGHSVERGLFPDRSSPDSSTLGSKMSLGREGLWCAPQELGLALCSSLY